MKSVDFDFSVDNEQLRDYTRDVVDVSLKLVEDLSREDLIGPYSPRLNPFLWELTHSFWFLEHWSIRKFQDEQPYFEDVDWLYNSPKVRHGQRWAEDLIEFSRVREFLTALSETLSNYLTGQTSEKFRYYTAYAILHCDMHTEALTYQRQTRALPKPSFETGANDPSPKRNQKASGDIEVMGGTFPLGADESNSFLFDNERWNHDVEVDDFKIASTPVTNEDFRKFVDAGGYRTPDHWSKDGWQWLQSSGQSAPRYWRKRDGSWQRRRFDEWVPLKPDHPVIHLNFYEAQAYCNWADRRLPTEAEWELVASNWHPDNPGKDTYPWGNEPPSADHANLDFNRKGTVSVHEYPAGDGRHGPRQLIGNCWEWTSSTFERFPGFESDYYVQYSQPWFGSRKVLRGGSWMTRSRLIRNGFRNFFTPDRNDIPAGFRTCATN